jgi:hypothetical protein
MMTIFTDTMDSDPERYEWLFGKAPCPYPLPSAEAAQEAAEAESGSEDERAPAEAQDAAPEAEPGDSAPAETGDAEPHEPEHAAEVPAAVLAEHPLDGAR